MVAQRKPRERIWAPAILKRTKHAGEPTPMIKPILDTSDLLYKTLATVELGKLKEDLESNQPSCPTFHKFTVWSGISGGLQDRTMCANGTENLLMISGKLFVMCMFILGKSMIMYEKYSV